MRQSATKPRIRGSAKEPRAKRTHQRRPDIVRSRVIESAVAAFTRDTFKGARMRDIAENAGVTIQLLVYHFRSKDELWKAAMLHILAIFEELHQKNRAPPSASASEKLKRFLSDTVHFTAEVPQLHRLMSQEAAQLSPRLVWLVDNWIRQRFEEFCKLVEECQREGTVRASTPARLYYACLAIASMPFSVSAEYEYLTGRSPFTPSEIEHTISLLRRMVFIQD